MAHSEETRLAFRAEYLRTRLAGSAAREIGIPESTGYVWARELDADPEFVDACRSLRARALPIAEAAILEGVEHARVFMADGGRDGAAWYRSLVEAYKAISVSRATLTEAGDVQQHPPVQVVLNGLESAPQYKPADTEQPEGEGGSAD